MLDNTHTRRLRYSLCTKTKYIHIIIKLHLSKYRIIVAVHDHSVGIPNWIQFAEVCWREIPSFPTESDKRSTRQWPIGCAWNSSISRSISTSGPINRREVTTVDEGGGRFLNCSRRRTDDTNERWRYMNRLFVPTYRSLAMIKNPRKQSIIAT